MNTPGSRDDLRAPEENQSAENVVLQPKLTSDEPLFSVGGYQNSVAQSVHGLTLGNGENFTREELEATFLKGVARISKVLKGRNPGYGMSVATDGNTKPFVIDPKYINNWIEVLDSFNANDRFFRTFTELHGRTPSHVVVIGNYKDEPNDEDRPEKNMVIGTVSVLLESDSNPGVKQQWDVTAIPKLCAVSETWAGILLAAKTQLMVKRGSADEQYSVTPLMQSVRARVILDILTETKLEELIGELALKFGTQVGLKEISEITATCDALVCPGEPARSLQELVERMKTYMEIYADILHRLGETDIPVTERRLTCLRAAQQEFKKREAIEALEKNNSTWDRERMVATFTRGIQTMVETLRRRPGNLLAPIYKKDSLDVHQMIDAKFIDDFIQDWLLKIGTPEGRFLDLAKIAAEKTLSGHDLLTSTSEGVQPSTAASNAHFIVRKGAVTYPDTTKITGTLIIDDKPITDLWAGILLASRLEGLMNTKDPNYAAFQLDENMVTMRAGIILNLLSDAKVYPAVAAMAQNHTPAFDVQEAIQLAQLCEPLIAGTTTAMSYEEMFERMHTYLDLYNGCLMGNAKMTNTRIEDLAAKSATVLFGRVKDSVQKAQGGTTAVKKNENEPWGLEQIEATFRMGVTKVVDHLKKDVPAGLFWRTRDGDTGEILGAFYMDNRHELIDRLQQDRLVFQEADKRNDVSAPGTIPVYVDDFTKMIQAAEGQKYVQNAVVLQVPISNSPTGEHLCLPTFLHPERPISPTWAGILLASKTGAYLPMNHSRVTDGGAILAHQRAVSMGIAYAMTDGKFSDVMKKALEAIPQLTRTEDNIALYKAVDWSIPAEEPRSVYEVYERLFAYVSLSTQFRKKEASLLEDGHCIMLMEAARRIYEEQTQAATEMHHEKKIMSDEEVRKKYTAGMRRVLEALDRRPSTWNLEMMEGAPSFKKRIFDAAYIDGLVADHLMHLANDETNYHAYSSVTAGWPIGRNSAIIMGKKEYEACNKNRYELVSAFSVPASINGGKTSKCAAIGIRNDIAVSDAWAGIILATRFEPFCYLEDLQQVNNTEVIARSYAILLGVSEGKIAQIMLRFAENNKGSFNTPELLELTEECNSLMFPNQPAQSLEEAYQRTHLYGSIARTHCDGSMNQDLLDRIDTMSIEVANRIQIGAQKEAPKKPSGLFDLETLAGLSELMGVDVG